MCSATPGAWFINMLCQRITDVTANRSFVCYTDVNAFATVC
jgi:hypothetical protein